MRTETVEVRIPVYVPLDPMLTTKVDEPMPPEGELEGEDVVDLAERRGAALRRANQQLEKIRELQPQPP